MSKGNTTPSPRIPSGIGKMTKLEAALTYASHGIYVLPGKPGNGSPGALLGKSWPEKSSRDPEVIQSWFKKRPDAELFIHLGPSGLIAFDLDKADSLAELPRHLRDSLAKGKFQRSRNRHSARGHYLYRVKPGERFSNSAGSFAPFGEVRGYNGVIRVAPSRHLKSARYRYFWPKSGAIPALSGALRSVLKEAAECEAALPDAELATFLDAYTDETDTDKLLGAIRTFERDVKDGKERHGSARDVLCMAFREAIAGFYPARRAYDEIETAFNAAFRGSHAPSGGRAVPTRGEFAGAAAWAAAQALTADPEEVRGRGRTKVAATRLVRASDVVEKPLEWLWPAHLAYGHLAEIIGDSNTGKSLIGETDFPARITRGWPFPGEPETAVREPGNVLITATEDGFRDVALPRLVAAGADLDRVFLFQLEQDENGEPIPLTLPDRAPELRAAVEESKAVYLVISPIDAYLSETIRSHVGASVRRALGPLVRIADDNHLAVLLVRHPNKNREMAAVDRGAGSGAFTQLVRSSFGTAKHPEEADTFVFSRIANNLAARGDNPSVKYSIVPSDLRPDQPVIEWGEQTSLTADDVMSKSDARKQSPARDAAEEALRELHEERGGRIPTDEVFEFVKNRAGVGQDTVRAACRNLGIKSEAKRSKDGKKIEHWEMVWPSQKIQIQRDIAALDEESRTEKGHI